MAGGVVSVPWYATLFRGDQLEAALNEIAPLAIRYGATSYHVYRNQDDRYKFFQFSAFESKPAWEKYWYGEDFIAWREDYSSYYQVPILASWNDLTASGVRKRANGNGNGHPDPDRRVLEDESRSTADTAGGT